VVKIIIAGVKYMFTDIITQKGQAKKDIQGALLGLLIIVSAVIILSVINPDLTKFDPNIGKIEDPGPQEKLTADDASFLQKFCEEQPCESRRCDALDDYTMDMILAGAAVGSSIPVVGTIAGGIAGYTINFLGTEAECRAICFWLGGEILSSTDSCLYPKDALALKEAEIRDTIKNSAFGSKLSHETDLSIYEIAELMYLYDLYFDKSTTIFSEEEIFISATNSGPLYDYYNRPENRERFNQIKDDLINNNPELSNEEINEMAVKTLFDENLFYSNSHIGTTDEGNLTVEKCPGTYMVISDIDVCLK
jgi:hypothetical protein